MKKGFLIILSAILIMSTIFASCSSSNKVENTTDNTSKDGLDAAQNEFGFDVVDVTDNKGEVVTDKDGKNVTTEIYVEYVTDKKGNTVAVEIDNDGKHVTNAKGEEVTHKTDYKPSTTSSKNNNDEDVSNDIQLPSVPETKPTTASTTMTTEKAESPTSAELTTIKRENEVVPSTSDKGEKVSFSTEDQQIIKQMLEVPYLYTESYENRDGVPISIATHAAIWMVQREAFNTTSYASSTVVLDLFNYFAQTVVNFKTLCNDANNENIIYKSINDTFAIKSFEAPTHSVTLQSIEYLGNNNYYKVTASVSGTKKAKRVVAIIQKNRLDSSLGFSVKALKWS